MAAVSTCGLPYVTRLTPQVPLVLQPLVQLHPLLILFEIDGVQLCARPAKAIYEKHP